MIMIIESCQLHCACPTQIPHGNRTHSCMVVMSATLDWPSSLTLHKGSSCCMPQEVVAGFTRQAAQQAWLQLTHAPQRGQPLHATWWLHNSGCPASLQPNPHHSWEYRRPQPPSALQGPTCRKTEPWGMGTTRAYSFVVQLPACWNRRSGPLEPVASRLMKAPTLPAQALCRAACNRTSGAALGKGIG